MAQRTVTGRRRGIVRIVCSVRRDVVFRLTLLASVTRETDEGILGAPGRGWQEATVGNGSAQVDVSTAPMLDGPFE
jgi:hypothetical protein